MHKSKLVRPNMKNCARVAGVRMRKKYFVSGACILWWMLLVLGTQWTKLIAIKDSYYIDGNLPLLLR
jgi:hypothetical protein